MHRLVFLRLVVVLKWLDLGGAAQDPDAAEVDIALFTKIVEAEALEEGEGVVVWIIVVPLEALGVVKDDVAGQALVSVDDVSGDGDGSARRNIAQTPLLVKWYAREEHHGLPAFVDCHRQRRIGIIDNIDILLPIEEIVVKPCDVLLLHAGNNQLDIVCSGFRIGDWQIRVMAAGAREEDISVK
jgi:hypothetical protein